MKKICYLVLVTMLLPGCAAFPAATTPTPSLIPTDVTPGTLPEPTDPTQVLAVKAGQNFDIVLPANSSTGYRWQITTAADANLVQPIGQTYVSEQSVMLGSGGMEVWTFSALAPGATKIEFGYFPPGNTTQPEETIIFSLSIE